MTYLAAKSKFRSYTSRGAVGRGVKFLDQYLPGWRDLVDVIALENPSVDDTRGYPRIIPAYRVLYWQLKPHLDTAQLIPKYINYWEDVEGVRHESAKHWLARLGFYAWASESADYDSELSFFWINAVTGKARPLHEIENGDAESFVAFPTKTPRHLEHYNINAGDLAEGMTEFLEKHGAVVTTTDAGFDIELPLSTVYRYDRWKAFNVLPSHERRVWLLADTVISCGYKDAHPGGLLFFFEKHETEKDDAFWSRVGCTWVDAFFPYAKEAK